MQVELHSREVLVTWVAFCLVHAATSKQHPVLQQYGAALDYRDLRHLVLSDCAANDALLAVAAHLQRHTKPGLQVFTLTNGGGATFAMAQQYAQDSAQLCGIWQAEQAAAEARKQAHWQEVVSKQQLANQLRTKLSSEKAVEAAANQEHQAAQHTLNAIEVPYGTSRYERKLARQPAEQVVAACLAELRQAQAACRATERALAQALKPPTPVFQPLPVDRGAALVWLFFLYMPPMFRLVS